MFGLDADADADDPFEQEQKQEQLEGTEDLTSAEYPVNVVDMDADGDGQQQEDTDDGGDRHAAAAVSSFRNKETRMANIRGAMIIRQQELLRAELSQKKAELALLTSKAAVLSPKESHISQLEMEVHGLERALNRLSDMTQGHGQQKGAMEDVASLGQTQKMLEQHAKQRIAVAHAVHRRQSLEARKAADKSREQAEAALREHQQRLETALRGQAAAQKRLQMRNEMVIKPEAEAIAAQLKAYEERRMASLLALKDSMSDISNRLASQREAAEARRQTLAAQREAEMAEILASGGNPHEIFRFREQQQALKKAVAAKAAAQAAREMEIAMRIHREAAQRHAQKEAAVRNESAALAGVPQDDEEERVAKYVASRTKDGRAVVDPTGRQAVVHPSTITSFKPWSFGTGKKLARADILEAMTKKYPKTHAVDAHSTIPFAKPQKEDERAPSKPQGSPTRRQEADGGVHEHDDIKFLQRTLHHAAPNFQGTWGVDLAGARGAAEEEAAGVGKKARRPAPLAAAEMSASPFAVTPSEACLFKDVEIRTAYTKTFTLSNTSSTLASFRILPLADEIRDMFELKFVPPGAMAPGVSTSIAITLLGVRPPPQQEFTEDISGAVQIAYPGGVMDIPLRVCPRRCLVELVSAPEIDFGPVVLAETYVRSFTLRNQGALDTECQVVVVDSAQISIQKSSSSSKVSGGQADESAVQQASFILDGYSSRTVSLSLVPAVLGPLAETAMVQIHFSRPTVNPVQIPLKAMGVPVSISLDRSTVDWKCIRPGILYRDSISVRNGGAVALKVGFPTDKRLAKSKSKRVAPVLEFVPAVAFVQPRSELTVQMKLFFSDASDGEDDAEQDDVQLHEQVVLDIPEQTMPVALRIVGRMTSRRLAPSPSLIDFGKLSPSQASCVPFSVKNCSQSVTRTVGFVNLPKFVSVEPNYFVDILPRETFQFKAIYSPQYNLTLGGGSASLTLAPADDPSQRIQIPVHAVVVDPILRVSSSTVRMKAVAMGDWVEETLVLEKVASGSAGLSAELFFLHPHPDVSVAPRVLDLSSGTASVVITHAPRSKEPAVWNGVLVCHWKQQQQQQQAAAAENASPLLSNVLVSVETATIAPRIECLSHPAGVVEFGPVAVLSSKQLCVAFSGATAVELDRPLCPHGAFEVVSFVREKNQFTVRFTPLHGSGGAAGEAAAVCSEKLAVRDPETGSRLEVVLRGTGVTPRVEVTPSSLLDVGDVVGGGVAEAPVKISTSSAPFAVDLRLAFRNDPPWFRVVPDRLTVPANSTAPVEARVIFAPFVGSLGGAGSNKPVQWGLLSTFLEVYASGNAVPTLVLVRGRVFQRQAPVLCLVPDQIPQDGEEDEQPVFGEVIRSGIVEFSGGLGARTSKKCRVVGMPGTEFVASVEGTGAGNFRVEPPRGPVGQEITVSFVPAPNAIPPELSVLGQSLAMQAEARVKIVVGAAAVGGGGGKGGPAAAVGGALPAGAKELSLHVRGLLRPAAP